MLHVFLKLLQQYVHAYLMEYKFISYLTYFLTYTIIHLENCQMFNHTLAAKCHKWKARYKIIFSFGQIMQDFKEDLVTLDINVPWSILR